jgi:PelA/Pel-15E family pectate lyase
MSLRATALCAALSLSIFGCTPPNRPPPTTPLPAAPPPANPAPSPVPIPSPTPSSSAAPAAGQRPVRIGTIVDKPDDWFKTPEGQNVADNIVGWQNANGGWFKNYDPRKPRPAFVPDVPNKGPASDADVVWHKVSTIDNDATYSEMRVIARAYRVLGKPAYKVSFDLGLNYLFEMQYPNGGFPQRYPLQDNYGRYITINDDAMLGAVSLMKDISDQKPDFTFVTDAQRRRAEDAYHRGIECFEACQIRMNGRPTVWCQQHDEVTLEPRGGRTFELPSFCGRESCQIVLFLMTIDNPDSRLQASINDAVAWLKSHEVKGKVYKQIDDPTEPRGFNRILLDDPKGQPLIARFYDLKSEQPFFCGRDGIRKSSVDQISYERRNGYEWWGTWDIAVRKEYKLWKAKLHETAVTTATPAK